MSTTATSISRQRRSCRCRPLRVQHAEIRQPHFARAFSLSPDLDAAKIEANLQDGVLKLTIPRRDEARPRRIEVTVA